MTTPELPQQPPLAAEMPLVTVVPNLNMLEISGLAEAPTERTRAWETPDTAARAGERLATLYLTVGRGVFSLEDIKAATGWDGRNVASMATQLAHALPSELFSADGKGKDRRFTFGDFRIASRMASDEEEASFATQKEAAKESPEEVFRKKKEAVDAADKDKTTLTQADHLLIQTVDKSYYMPIDTASSILAARTLQALRAYRETYLHAEIRFSELCARIWDEMPLVERQLFAKTEKQLYGNGSVLDKTAKQIMSAVMHTLGVARRHSLDSHFNLMDVEAPDILVMNEPPEKPYDPAAITPIFPPGTNKSLLYTQKLGEATPEQNKALIELLDQVLNKSKLTHNDAINILDIVTDARSSAYARRILKAHFDIADGEATLQHLDSRSKATLGYGRYTYARRERTIRGTKGSGDVQQVSRNLPGRTFKHINDGGGRDFTSKWHFGKRERER